jgi:broad specificity phosphatase PhoE
METPVPAQEAWLVRHGQTAWSLLGRHTGVTDIPLTDEGRLQARAVRAALSGPAFAMVLSSPRSRALETAKLSGLGARVEVDPDLAEWDYGELEGLTTPEIRALYPGWSIWEGPWPGGESAEAVGARADRVVARLREAAGPVAVFSHGHLLRVLAARWIGRPPAAGGDFALGTATLSVLGWEHARPVVARWNEACTGGPRVGGGR